MHVHTQMTHMHMFTCTGKAGLLEENGGDAAGQGLAQQVRLVEHAVAEGEYELANQAAQRLQPEVRLLLRRIISLDRGTFRTVLLFLPELHAPSLDDIARMHSFIRGAVGPTRRILYGGSVKPTNAKDILRVDHVGGALVGGASLKADDFIEIIAAA